MNFIDWIDNNTPIGNFQETEWCLIGAILGGTFTFSIGLGVGLFVAFIVS